MKRAIAVALCLMGCAKSETKKEPECTDPWKCPEKFRTATPTRTTQARDDEADRRAGFADVANKSFAEHPAAGYKLTARVEGDRNTTLVLDVTSESCTEQVLRQVELVMGSDHVISAGFEKIRCATGDASIAP